MEKMNKIFRYLIAGGTALVTNLFFLYALTEWLGLYYLVSVVVAFLLAVAVSFLMQKYLTFRDRSVANLHRQMMIYLTAAVINTGINTLLVYLFVEYGGWHYLVGQIVASAIIAIESFFVYQKLIFHQPH